MGQERDGDGGVREQLRIARSLFETYTITPTSEILVGVENTTTRFAASVYGDGNDNPEDPDNLTPLQKDRAVSFTFANKGRVLFHFHAEGTRPAGGRNFLIGGAALVPPCDSPPPAPPPSPPSVPSEIELVIRYPPNPRSAGEKICLHTESFNTDADGAYEFTARFPAADLVEGPCPDDLLDPCDAQTNGAVILYLTAPAGDADARPRCARPPRRRPAAGARRPQADQALRQGVPSAQSCAQRAARYRARRQRGVARDESWMVYVSYYAYLDARPDRPPIEEVLTTLGSSFSFAATSEPGMYAVRVRARGPSLEMAPTQLNALWNDHSVALRTVLLKVLMIDDDGDGVPDDGGGMAQGEGAVRALLTWSSHATIGLDLFLTFKYMGGLRCDVWAGRERCSSGAWSPYTGGTQSELVSVSKFRPGTEYTLYARRSDRRCYGYNLHSSPLRPGGNTTVDCVGDCTTGEGYCYAFEEANGDVGCASCALWDAEAKGMVSCLEYGLPQGGPLPGTSEWDDHGGCNIEGWAAEVGGEGCLSDPQAAWNVRGGATVSIVQGKTVKNTLYLEEDALRAAGVWDVPGTSGFYAARVGCVSSDATGAATVTPTAVVKPLSPAEFMHEVYDRGSSGCSQEAPLGAWPCAGWKTPEGWAC